MPRIKKFNSKTENLKDLGEKSLEKRSKLTDNQIKNIDRLSEAKLYRITILE